MKLQQKGLNGMLALTFLCLGIAFAAIAFAGSDSRLTFGLAAVTNLCAAIVFFLRHRAGSGSD
ncbi:MAG: hypothetical protein RLW62_09440 [Gammaproteobacteria bacterium]